MQQWWAIVGLVGQVVGCRESGFGWVRDFWLFGLLGYDVVVVGGGVVGGFVVVVWVDLGFLGLDRLSPLM